ncbi:MAG: condensation domain-containing protein, partial [Tumebacillaceae bacterium]
MLWMQETFPLQQGDRVLQKTPFSFDASVWEFYAPLLAGAELVIAEPGRHMDTSYLSDVIRNRKITTLQLVPTLLQMLLDEPTFATCTSLQRVFCGGEALTPELVERFFLAMPESVDLINLYGPTECCIDSTYHICERDSRLRSIPIGKPIANAQTLVLDERMQPVPVGVLGELYIGGLGVALGYLHRPELTAERFVRHEFEESSEHTQFLYKTGDQVRRLSDGNLEYVGRADSQVKMRGFRIELGEIEKVIGQHDDVREAVVIAHEYSPGDKRLVGYFVPEASAKPVIDHLRDHLRGKLPDYMVPATFVMLDELPLSPSGKVNRKALPIPELESQQKQATYIAPRNPVEELLERIFGEVLHHDTVSVHDNFFDLGGHSLLVTQVISRIRNAFHITLPFSEMFNDPTIAGLAKRVQRAMNEGRAAQEKPLQTVSRNQALPLSFAQQRLWFLDQFAGTAYNITTPLRLLGALDVHALERSLHEMVRRHESLRTTFAEQDGLSVQVIAPTLDLHVQQTDLSALEAGERDLHVQRLITEETLYRFDLTHGPLIRAHLLRLSAEEHVLLVNMHHIVTDGSSTDIFLQELSRLYLSFVENRPADLPELQVQYADYAHWQRDWLQGEELEKQLMYWKGKLAGKLPVLHLPYDHSRPEFPVNKGLYQWFVIPTAVVAKLQAFSQQEMATLFMTMLATYNVLLHRYSKQEDILVGTPVSNRNRSEVENVIGNFVNTLVMRNHVSDHLTFREFVRAVRETALGAYTHQELPFEKLVEELHPERSRSVSPLFQAWFLLVQAAEPASWGGLQSNLLEVASGSTKWDITLGMVEVPDGYRVVLECSADLFQLSTVEQIAHGYETLIGLVAGEPDMLLRDLFEQLEQAELDYLKQKKAQFNDKWKSKLKRPR